MPCCFHNLILLLFFVSSLCIPVAAWSWSEFLRIFERSASKDPPDQIADMVRTIDGNLISPSFPNRITIPSTSSKPSKMSSSSGQFFTSFNRAITTSDVNTSLGESEPTEDLIIDAFPSISAQADTSIDPTMSMDSLIDNENQIISNKLFPEPTVFGMENSRLFVESTSPQALTESTLEPTVLPTIDLIAEDIISYSEFPNETPLLSMEISSDFEMSYEPVLSTELNSKNKKTLKINSSSQSSEPVPMTPEESSEYALITDDPINFSTEPSAEASEEYEYATSSTSVPSELMDLLEKRNINFSISEDSEVSETFMEESAEATPFSRIPTSSSSEKAKEEELRSFVEGNSPEPSQSAIPLTRIRSEWDEFYMQRSRRSGSSEWRMRERISREPPIDIEVSEQPIEADPMSMGDYDMRIEASSVPGEKDPMISSDHPCGFILHTIESAEANEEDIAEESESEMSTEPNIESSIRDMIRVKSGNGGIERGLIGEEELNEGVKCTVMVGKEEGKKCEEGYVCVIKELGTGTGFLSGICELESNDIDECGLRLCTDIGHEGRCVVRVGNEQVIETSCGSWSSSEAFDCGSIRCNGECEGDVRDNKDMRYCNRCLLEMSSCASNFRLIAK